MKGREAHSCPSQCGKDLHTDQYDSINKLAKPYPFCGTYSGVVFFFLLRSNTNRHIYVKQRLLWEEKNPW